MEQLILGLLLATAFLFCGWPELPRAELPPALVFFPLPPEDLKKLNAEAMTEVKNSKIRSASVVGIHHMGLDTKKLFEQVLQFPDVSSVPPVLFKLSGSTSAVVIVTDRLQTVGERITWAGHIQDKPRSSALFLVDTTKREISGEIRTNGIVYEIRPGKGKSYAIFAIDTRLLPSNHSFKWLKPPYPLKVPPELIQGIKKRFGSPIFIDVAVFYTQAAMKADTSEDITTHICRAMQLIEESFINSGVEATHVRLVHHEKIEFPESGRVEQDVMNLRDPSFPATEGIPDYHPKRRTYGADLVSLWVGDGDDCGAAQPIIQPGGDGALAFSVVRRNCATAGLSFSHELGHLMGAYHDRFDAQAADDQGHNYGYLRPSRNWKTIMAVDRPDCPSTTVTQPDGTTITKPFCERINYWSNPLKNYPPGGGGHPMGRPSTTAPNPTPSVGCRSKTGDPSACDGPADNTATLNANATAVSEFMSPGILGNVSCGGSSGTAPPLAPKDLKVQ